MKDSTILAVAAMMCVTILEVCALFHGINGSMFIIVVVAIGTFAGYELRGIVNGRRDNSESDRV